MRNTYGGPRLLLRRLREVMTEPVNAQARLDKVAVMVAANMVAEVCSLYLLRADGFLEMFATEGLATQAVHKVQMRVGHGLVGQVAQLAEPLNLSEAQTHLKFILFDKIGEEIYNSFLGVPILRAGDVLGVLVVQNRAQRIYTEDEVKSLEAIALVLADTLIQSDVAHLSRSGMMLAAKRPLHITGLSLSDAIGLGHVVLHVPRVAVSKLVATDTGEELKRLELALTGLLENIDAILAQEDLERGDHRDIMEAYRLFASDQRWAAKMREAVEAGLSAEAAVEKVQSETRARMLRVEDPYLRERLHDFDDLANRLMRQLSGENVAARKLPKDAVIVARNMGPAELLDYDRSHIRALVLEEGSPTSHVSIVARALGLACVGQVENIVALVEDGDAIITDGSAGEVHVRPPLNVEQAYAEKVRFRAKRLAHYQTLRDKPSRTKDGKDIGLYLNAGLLVDLPYLKETNAEGIGLFRTELQFMVAAKFPRISAQRDLYRQVFEAAGDRPVVFRSLDIGGDKILPYMRIDAEENPAMGWRAIRLTLDRPGLLRSQVRALLMAADGRPLNLLFPMIAHLQELKAGRAVVEQELAFLKKHGHRQPDSIRIGAMVEVPAILWQLEELVRHVDFLSVGSNDLMQFVFAADRTSSRMAKRYDPLSQPMLRVLKKISDVAHRAHVPLTLCGELGSNPLEAMAVLALGYDKISMSPASIGPVKAMLMSLDLAHVKAEMNGLLSKEVAGFSMRPDLIAYAAQHKVALN